MYLGFDISGYPGDDVLASLHATGNVPFVAAYLAPTPNHPDDSWMSHVQGLVEAGWGLAPVYVGRQAGSSFLDSQNGQSDAQQCAGLADGAALPHGRVVYLDVETSADVGDDHLDYIAAWVAGITDDGRYTPGIYCFARPTVAGDPTTAPAAQIAARIGGGYPFWVCRFPSITDITIDVASESPPDPANSGYAAALAQQYRQSGTAGSVTLQWQDAAEGTQSLVDVDVDSCATRDPSVLPAPTPASVDPSQASICAGVQVTGSGFAGVDTVTFGTASADVAHGDIALGPNGVDTIQVTVPDGAPTGQLLDVTLHNIWGITGTLQQAVTID